MKDNLINEELKRFKLLTTYNSKMTLTENESKISINEVSELGEQTSKQFMKLFGLTSDDIAKTAGVGKNMSAGYLKARNLIDDVIPKNGIPLDDNIVVAGRNIGKVAKNADEVLEAIRLGKISGDGLGIIAKGLLKRGKLTGNLRTGLIDKAADISVQSGQIKTATNQIKKIDDLTEKQLSQILKGKGYADDVADDIAARIKLKKGGGGGKNPPPPVPTPVPVPVPPPPPVPWYERLWANKVFKVGMIAAAGAGTLALLQWWFSKGSKEPEVKWIPGCLKIIYADGSRGLTAQDLMTAAQTGDLSSLPIANPAVVDANGQKASLPGSVFDKNGGFKSSSGSGNWKVDGDKVVINQGENVYYIDCSDTIENIKPEPPSPAPVPGGCTPTSDFPFGYYQMNSMVGSVQNCVGARADNCMGPQTARKIQQFLGLTETPTSLTKDIYDKVMVKCKGSTSTKQEPIKEPTQTSGEVDDFES